MSDCRCKLKFNKLEEGIMSNSWLVVIVDGKLKTNKIEARNTE